MSYKNSDLVQLLSNLDLGSSVAEEDTLLETARIETSAFSDLLNDRVDLIPGTKGSGKSALFRIFVDFLPNHLLDQRKVVVAHGVEAPGDPVFHAFSERFGALSEEEFVSFWCIYMVSLAHEQFIKSPRYRKFLKDAQPEIAHFRQVCSDARIPEIVAPKSLRGVLEWCLNALQSWRPTARYIAPDGSGTYELDLFGQVQSPPDGKETESAVPRYINDLSQALQAVLAKSRLSVWLMVDRLDEVFPRRSETERRALRGLLRAMRYFSSAAVRVKVFLRDDMLDQIVRGGEGFTALTHVTVRKSDTLRWTEDQLLTLIVTRFTANAALSAHLGVDSTQVSASALYRESVFRKIFPPTVYRGPKQSPTMRWIYNRCADGRGVVTPRDVLDLLIRAIQRQQDLCSGDLDGTCEHVIDSQALQYGFIELSKRKRQTYLEAEFPHLWVHMSKFVGGRTDYNASTLKSLLGKDWARIAEQLEDIGFLFKRTLRGEEVYSVPFLYRMGMDLTQGSAGRS